jgi:hypothetical protein
MVAGCRNKTDCVNRANAAAAYFAKMDHDPSLDIDGVALAVRDDLEASDFVRFGSSLVVDGSDISFKDGPREKLTLTTLAPQLEIRLQNQLRYARDSNPPNLNVLLSQTAAWQQVVDVMAVVHAKGFHHVSLVFSRTPAISAPARTKIDDELDRLLVGPADSRAVQLAEFIGPKVEACPGIVSAFGDVAAEAGPEKGRNLLSKMGPALIDCDCAVAPEELTSLLWRTIGNPRPVVVLNIELSPNVDGSKAQVVSAAGDAMWRDVNRRFTPDTKVAWLTVK